MGGWFSLGVCILAAYRIYVKDLTGIFGFTVVVAILNFISFGIMHNFSENPISAPGSWTLINMITTLTGIGLLIYSFIR